MRARAFLAAFLLVAALWSTRGWAPVLPCCVPQGVCANCSGTPCCSIHMVCAAWCVNEGCQSNDDCGGPPR
jgi:hypothetical protein